MTINRESSDSETNSPTKKSKPKTATKAPAKWTDGEIKLLCSLRQQGKSFEYIPFRVRLRFRELVTDFPGRTTIALKRAVERRGKEVQEEFTEGKVWDIPLTYPDCRMRRWNMNLKIMRGTDGFTLDQKLAWLLQVVKRERRRRISASSFWRLNWIYGLHALLPWNVYQTAIPLPNLRPTHVHNLKRLAFHTALRSKRDIWAHYI